MGKHSHKIHFPILIWDTQLGMRGRNEAGGGGQGVGSCFMGVGNETR